MGVRSMEGSYHHWVINCTLDKLAAAYYHVRSAMEGEERFVMTKQVQEIRKGMLAEIMQTFIP